MPREPREPRSDFSRLDWRREGLRLVTRTPAKSREEWREYRDLCSLLWREGQQDVLLAVKAHAITLREVRDEVRRTGDFSVQGLMSRLLLRRELHAVLTEAVKRIGRTTSSRDRNRHTLAKLVRAGVVVPKRTKVRDLIAVDWHAVREQWTARAPGGKRRRSSSSDWNHAARFLSSALTHLFGGGRTGQSHPFRKQVLDRFPSETEYEREVTLTLDAFAQLVDLLPEDKRPAIITLALTGIRLDEYLTLTPASLEPAGCVIRVDGKTGPRPVKVQQEVWPFIAAAVPPRWKSPHALREPFKAAAAQVGHPDLRLHDLRHLNATAMLWAGANIGEVRDALGHADAKTTMRYVKGANRASAAKAAAAAFAPVLKVAGGKGA